jgi:hypothetical protein
VSHGVHSRVRHGRKFRTLGEPTLGVLNPKGNVHRANSAGRVAFLRLKRRSRKNWAGIVSGASCMGRRLPPSSRLSTASRSTLDKLGGAVFSAGLVPPPESPQLDRCWGGAPDWVAIGFLQGSEIDGAAQNRTRRFPRKVTWMQWGGNTAKNPIRCLWSAAQDRLLGRSVPQATSAIRTRRVS